MRFARIVFTLAGIGGLLLLLPMYFLEKQIGIDHPPAVTHPEHFYGFVGVASAWQVLFLILARDPVRFRPMMVPAVLEKLSFGLAGIVLFALGRIPGVVFGAGLMDLTLGVLFAIAWWRTPRE